MPPDAGVGLVDAASVWLLTYLVHSTALIGGAWVVTRLLRLEPATRDFVWRVAILGGVATASGATLMATRGPGADGLADVRHVAIRQLEASGGLPRSPTPAASSFVAERGPTVEGGTGSPPLVATLGLTGDERSPPALGTLEPSLELDGVWVWPGGIVEVEEAWGVTGRPLPGACRDALGERAGDAAWLSRVEEACASEADPPWRGAMVLVWLVGAAVGLAGFGRAVASLAAVRRSFSDASPRVQTLLHALDARRGVRLVTSPVLAAPCVLPGRTIGLPERCVSDLSDAELRAVLAHELAHVARRDVAWSSLMRILGAVLWLQPLNRVAAGAATRAGEEACDDWALARTGERIGLAASIARVAEWASGGTGPHLQVSMAGGEGPVTGRVRRILSGRRRTEPRWKGFLIAALIAAPLPFLPAPSGPRAVRTAVFVRTERVEGFIRAPDAQPGDSVTARILVRRVRGA